MDARENSGYSRGFASEEELKALTLSSLFMADDLNLVVAHR